MDVSDRQFLEMQVDALFTHDADGRIRWVNEQNGDRAPRFFFGRTREGNLWRVRFDVADEMARELERLAMSEPVCADLRAEPDNLARFRAVLGADPGTEPIDWGPAYRFPADIPGPADAAPITPANVHLVEAMGEEWEQFGLELASRRPCCAVVEGGVAVAVCFSSRLTKQVAEAGVETLEGYRGRGYAPVVVSTWAWAVRSMGRIPLYSTSWENLSSQAVARKLGLIQYGVDLSL